MNPNDVKHFSSSVEVSFPRPIAWTPDLLEKSASKLAEAVGFALRSDQFRVRNSDMLYNYDLMATFFNGNAYFIRNADRLSLNLNNAQGTEDLKVALDVLERFGDLFLANTRWFVQLTAAVHLDLGTQENRHRYLKRFSPSERVQLPGAVGYISTELSDKGADPIRIMIEPSLSFPEALFVSFRAALPSPDNWKVGLKMILESFNESAKVYDLEVGFPAR